MSREKERQRYTTFILLLSLIFIYLFNLFVYSFSRLLVFAA